MIEFDTIEAAQAHPGIVHIEAGAVVRGYEAGDEFPAHLIVQPTEEADPEPTAKGVLVAISEKMGWSAKDAEAVAKRAAEL